MASFWSGLVDRLFSVVFPTTSNLSGFIRRNNLETPREAEVDRIVSIIMASYPSSNMNFVKMIVLQTLVEDQMFRRSYPEVEGIEDVKRKQAILQRKNRDRHNSPK